jgi:NADH-quinone oxidoreductase subunit C
MYYAMNPDLNAQVILKVNISRDNPVLPTMTKVWSAMSFHEREAREMFGIMFEGHDNLIPLLLPPDWKGGYPLRKDFKGEGVIE